MKLKSILCFLAVAFSLSVSAQNLRFVANATSPGYVSPTEINVEGYTVDDYAIFDLVIENLGDGSFSLAGWEGTINWGTFVFHSPLQNIGGANSPFELVSGVEGLPTSQVLPADQTGAPTTSTGSNPGGVFRGGAVILNQEERPNTGTLILGRWRLYPARFHDSAGNARDVVSCVSSEEFVRFVANDISSDRHIIAKSDATAASSSEVTFNEADLTVRLVNASAGRKKLDTNQDTFLDARDLLPWIRCVLGAGAVDGAADCGSLSGDALAQVYDANCDGSVSAGDLTLAVRRIVNSITRSNKKSTYYDLEAGAGTLVLKPAEGAGSLFATSLMPRGGQFADDAFISQAAINKGWNLVTHRIPGSDQLNIVLFNVSGDEVFPEVNVNYSAQNKMSYFMGRVDAFDQNNAPVSVDTSKVSFETIKN